MIEMKQFRFRALFTAVFVSFGILTLAAGLNELTATKNKKDIGPAVAFQVKKQAPKKAKKVVRKKRSQPKPRPNKAPPPPMLSGAGALSGVAVAGLTFLRR